MRTIFIADAHLHAPGDENYILLLRFLEEIRGNVDCLCILGDLFDFRIGVPSLSFPEQNRMLEAIARVREAGARIIYLEGNHDFHLGKEFAAATGFELHPRPVVAELHGKRIFMCHGDLVNPADWKYRLLHLAIRNRITARAGRLLPASALYGVRKRLQHTSRSRYDHDRSRWDYASIIRKFAEKIRLSGYDAVVLGHFHLPFIEGDDSFTLLSLGDWIGQFSYGILDDDRFSLCSYSPLQP